MKGRRGDYGVYAPAVVRDLTLLGTGLFVLGLLFWFSGYRAGQLLGEVLLLAFGIGLAQSLYLFWSLKVGRFRERERLVDMLRLQGEERVLDVGCGRGLLLTEVARRLHRGRATGLDIWNEADQSGNRPEAALENARIEGVADRVELVDGDARQMPFGDHCFDAVVSSLVLHNISDRGQRLQALREILRVLKPGGRLAVLDFQYADEYAEDLRSLGARDVQVAGPHFLMFPPVWIVTASKSRAS
jgi:SAM-dependent methyltransferase